MQTAEDAIFMYISEDLQVVEPAIFVCDGERKKKKAGLDPFLWTYKIHKYVDLTVLFSGICVTLQQTLDLHNCI